MFSFTL